MLLTLRCVEATFIKSFDRSLMNICEHPAISSGFLPFGLRAYVSTIRERTRAHYFPRHFDRAHTAEVAPEIWTVG